MKLAIICGSSRQQSQSQRVGEYCASRTQNIKAFENTWQLNLATTPLPLWQEDVWDSQQQWHSLLNETATQLQSSEALVIISPEWHGMAPAALKNFFFLWNENQLAHKPALLITVSSGVGGSYPIAELRSSSYKNSFITYIPDQVIVRDVNNMLHPKDKKEQSRFDQEIRQRIDYTLNILAEYAKALSQVRNSGAIDLARFPNGM